MLLNIVNLVIDAILGLLTFLVVARFFMQWARLPFHHPVGAFVVQMTQWLVGPLRRGIPGWGGYDWASLVGGWILQCAGVALILAVRGVLGALDPLTLAGVIAGQGGMMLLRVIIYFFIGALILQAVLSWVNPHSPLAGPLNQLTRPLLRPIQRFVPPVANVDLSPLVLLLLAQIVLVVLT